MTTPSDDVAAAAVANKALLDKLVDKAILAVYHERHAYGADLWRRATVLASELYGGESLTAVRLQLRQAASLNALARVEGQTQEEVVDHRRSAWALVTSVVPILSQRMTDNRILPGRCSEDEEAFYRRHILVACRIRDRAVDASTLDLYSKLVGYTAALDAAKQACMFLPTLRKLRAAIPLAVPQVRAEFQELLTRVVLTHEVLALQGLFPEREQATQAFVLRVVDLMLPATAAVNLSAVGEEKGFTSILLNLFARPPFDDFVTALLSKWTQPAMVAMRRAREMEDVLAESVEVLEGEQSRRRDDVAEHGLKICSLPSCDKEEATVQQFKFCSACRSVWYCSAEHAALHWKEHKPVCRATTAAKQAALHGGGAALK